MFIAAFIFVISLAALVQFAVFSWRAGLLSAASESLPNEVELSTLSRNLLESKNFKAIAAYQELCPEAGSASGPSLRTVRLYYRFLQSLSSLGGSILEAALPTSWAQHEMALCTRYATVVLSHRLERNQALSAEVRAF